MKRKIEVYDVCIIGSGPGGYACAMRCLDFKNDICIVERGSIGGIGIMNGALTSKAMWEASTAYSRALEKKGVFRAGSIYLDEKGFHDYVLSTAKQKQLQIISQLETFAPKEGVDGSVTLVKGDAVFRDGDSVLVTKKNGETEIIRAKNFVIATGGRPRSLPGVPFDGKQIVSSDHLLDIGVFPPRVMVIGAGIIGCEFCTIMANLKKTQVHLLDRANRVIPFEDDDISQFVHRNLERIGVCIHSNATLREIRKEGSSVEVMLEYQDGHVDIVEVDMVLVSIGRDVYPEELRLENARIDYEPTTTLHVDEDTRVHKNIYAVGDMSGNAALYAVAEMEGRYCATVLNGAPEKANLRYGLMPTIMFFAPEVSSIGYNEKQCQNMGIAYRMVNYSLELSNRAIAMGDTNGFVKLIVSDENDPVILGVRAAGPQASSLIMAVGMLIDNKISINTILRTVHPHPAITEVIQDAIRVLLNKPIYKRKAFPQYIRVCRWNPSMTDGPVCQ